LLLAIYAYGTNTGIRAVASGRTATSLFWMHVLP
jgi:hypothetical protein